MRELIYRKVEPRETDLMRQIYALRYEVYALESKFINPDDYPDNLEFDHYDKQAQHFVALTPEGEVMGTVRLILPSRLPLPIEKHCPYIRDHQGMFNPYRYGEISRLVISKKLRLKKNFSRLCQNQYTFEDEIPEQLFQCMAKCVTIGLCGHVYEHSISRGISHWYALMEKPLWLLLGFYGFRFQCIGPELDYFGPVYPYIVTLIEVEQAIMKFVDRHSCPILESRLYTTNGLDFSQKNSSADLFEFPA